MRTNILSYMNNFGNRQYTKYELTAIAYSISLEYYDRKEKGLIINTRTKLGKKEINERIVKFANSRLNSNNIKVSDVELYKKCRAIEYEDRTGRCMWGFKEKRKQLGYDPETGLELKEEN